MKEIWREYYIENYGNIYVSNMGNIKNKKGIKLSKRQNKNPII